MRQKDLAVHEIGAIRGVVAGVSAVLAVEQVETRCPQDEVVSGSAIQGIAPGTADNQIVARAAVDPG
jgi:hypothetical protein